MAITFLTGDWAAGGVQPPQSGPLGGSSRPVGNYISNGNQDGNYISNGRLGGWGGPASPDWTAGGAQPPGWQLHF